MGIKEEMLSKKAWAVVGATEKKDKWGSKIYKILKAHDYKTYGVSPNYEVIDGDKAYRSVKDIEDKVDVIDMVVAPKIALNVLEEAKEAGIQYIFFQPGTYNDEVVARAEELGLKYLLDDCIYRTLRNS